MSKSYFTYGLTSIKGTGRDVNEDTAIALIWSDVARFEGQNIGLFIVADGMGNGHSGLNASHLAGEIVSQAIKNAISQPKDMNISQLMTEAVEEANQQVIKLCIDGGTTLTAALLIGNQIHIAHVGDSRLYYSEGEAITQMTIDHVFMDITIVESFGMDQETYEKIPRRNVLYRALGQSKTINVDFRSKELASNSRLLLCTAGLISLDTNVTQADILPIIDNNDPQNACDQLIELAQKHGSTDDITAIVIKLL